MSLESIGKFIDGAVRPAITFGLAAVLAYMAVGQGNRDAIVAVIALTPMAVGFWFKDRNTDKAADATIAANKVGAARQL